MKERYSNKSPKPLPSQDELKKLFRYDAEEGKLFWRPRTASDNDSKRWNLRCAYKEAGTFSNGYQVVKINGSIFKSHRIIYKLHYGEEPGIIDHHNHDGQDNRISNLRSGSLSDNNRNRRVSKANTSGVTGVVRNNGRGKKWGAQIWHNGKSIRLGHFTKKSDAIAARKQAEKQFNFHPNHGASGM